MKKRILPLLLALLLAISVAGIPAMAAGTDETVADNTYSVTTTVEPDEDGDFDEYSTTTAVVVSGGKITSITTQGSGDNYGTYKQNATKNAKAMEKILSQLQDKDATLANVNGVDTVSGATCSSKAIISGLKKAFADAPAAKTESTVNLAGYTTSLNGKIEMNFYMELSDDVAADSTAYMSFKLPGSNHTSDKVMLSDARTSVRGSTTYYIFSAGVAAKDMTSDITAQFVWSGGESEEWTYTVKDYCDYICDNPSDYDEESVELAECMLNYGGYAQTYFKYNTSKLANAGLNKALPNVSLGTSYDPVTSGSCTGLTYSGSSAMLTTTTGIRHYFTTTGSIDDYTFKVGSTVLTPVKSGNYYYVLIDDIAAKNLSKAYALTVTGTDGKVFTLKYSVYSNVKQILADSSYGDAAQNLMRAVYAYGTATVAYLNSR